jgi:hypothetical protein
LTSLAQLMVDAFGVPIESPGGAHDTDRGDGFRQPVRVRSSPQAAPGRIRVGADQNHC